MTDNKVGFLKEWPGVNEYCDTILKLRNGVHENYKNRQTYEWKMCFSIWTFIVAVTGILLTKKNIPIDFWHHVILSVVIVFIHIVWQLNLKKSNDMDMAKINSYEKETRRLLDFGLEEKNREGEPLILKSWSHKVYIIITGVLLFTSVYIVNKQQQNNIILPNDIQGWLENKHLIDIQDKQKYIIKKLRSVMISEGKTYQANPANVKSGAAE